MGMPKSKIDNMRYKMYRDLLLAMGVTDNRIHSPSV